MQKKFALIILILLGLTPSLVLAQSPNETSRSRFTRNSIATVVTPAPIPSIVPVVQPVATPTPIPNSPIAVLPSGDFATQVEQFINQEINTTRAQNGLSPLSSDTRLASIARAYSSDMLTKNYFSHTSLLGCDTACRFAQGNYLWRSYGENLHWMSGYNFSPQDSAKKAVADWMNSPGHRANILGSSFTVIGTGVSVQGSKIYSASNFARPQ
jgi:uncharacterized protein YkwD